MMGRCASGDWSGEWCDGEGTHAVTYVPVALRGTAEAARSWHGLTETIRVCAACAALMRASEPEWIDG